MKSLKQALEDAVTFAINSIGMAEFKKLPFFMSNNKGEKNENHSPRND